MESECITLEVINDQDALLNIVKELLDVEIFAIDTEFHREKTYYPKLALLQLRWADRIAILDPLDLELTKLAPVFSSNSLAVFHAGSQDLEVLHRATGAVDQWVQTPARTRAQHHVACSVHRSAASP